MVRPKNETEDLCFLTTKNCETLIKQTHRKPEEALEFKLTKPRETFQFIPPISIKGTWMLGLTSLEVYKSIFEKQKKITNSNFIQILLMSSHLQK